MRGVLTMAYGSGRYLQMAIALARSIRLHSPDTPIAIITDSNAPSLLRLFDKIIPLRREFGHGMLQKLFLDIYSPYDDTLYIDSDCLIYADLHPVWNHLSTTDGFSVIGWGTLGVHDSHYAVEDLGVLMHEAGISSFPHFCAGVIRFDRSAKANGVFVTARSLIPRTKELGIRGYRGVAANDEPIWAVAMALEEVNAAPFSDIVQSPVGECSGLLQLNVIEGKSSFVKSKWAVAPVILHFKVEAQCFYVYLREMYRLEFASRRFSALAPLVAVIHYVSRRIGSKMARLKKSKARSES